MGEREIVIDKQRFTYEGYFDPKQLYAILDEWFADNWYDRREKKHTESTTKEGILIDIEFEPWKTVTDYLRFIIKLRLQITGKETTIETPTGKKRMYEGKVHGLLNAYLETDNEGRWQSKAFFIFISALYDKYLYKPLTGGYQAILKQETNSLVNTIRGYLNVTKKGYER